MKILITGGCGFIGSNLIRILNNNGFKEICVVDDLSKGELSYIEGSIISEFYQRDIRDYNELSVCFQGVDIVIHLAAYGSVVESIDEPQQNFDINTAGTLNILRQSIANNVTKVIFASTGGALIGNADPPVSESSVPRPISPYGASKLACEGYCCAFSHSYNVDITSLRFANVVGPTSYHKKGAVTAFLKAVINKNPIEIYGDGTATRDFLHVDDLCNGILLALKSKKHGYSVYHLASGQQTSVIELASEVIKVTGGKHQEIIYHKKRVGEVEKNFATYDLAKTELGFKPKYSLQDAILDTYGSFLQWKK